MSIKSVNDITHAYGVPGKATFLIQKAKATQRVHAAKAYLSSAVKLNNAAKNNTTNFLA